MDQRKADQLGARIAPQELDGATAISYRVAGRQAGPPDGGVRLSGDGTLVRATSRTALGGEPTRAVFAALRESLPSLVTREEARFPPDSVLGIVTLDLGGDQTELFFMADEQQAATAGAPLPPIARALDRALEAARTEEGTR